MKLLEELCHPDEEVFFRLYLEEDKGIFYAHWLGVPTQKDLQLAMHKGLNHLHQYDISQVLNDHTRHLGDWADVCSWIRVLWTPKSIHNSLRYFAHVLPSKHKSTQETNFQDMVHGAVCKTFRVEKDALDWLQSTQKKALA